MFGSSVSYLLQSAVAVQVDDLIAHAGAGTVAAHRTGKSRAVQTPSETIFPFYLRLRQRSP